MSGSVNKVIIVGNLGRDPEVKTLNSGDKVVNLSIATSERWNDKATGEKKERTEWHRVVIFNPHLAEVAEKYLKKGSSVYVEGQLQTRKWTDNAGVEKYSTEVVLQRFRGELTLLGSRDNGGEARAGRRRRWVTGRTRRRDPVCDKSRILHLAERKNLPGRVTHKKPPLVKGAAECFSGEVDKMDETTKDQHGQICERMSMKFLCGDEPIEAKDEHEAEELEVGVSLGIYGVWRWAASTAMAGLLAGTTLSPCWAVDSRPNILLIVADDLGYSDVGYQGTLPTPSIDRLARQGTVATQGYVAASVCSPSRAGMMTGKYPQRFGYYDNPPSTTDPRVGLPVSETTIADDLRGAGYWTAAIGKWHLGRNEIHHPLNRGFNAWYGFRSGHHDYYAGVVERNRQAVGFSGYLTDVLAREAIAQMRARDATPWFIYLAFNAPHSPLQAPPNPAPCSGLSGERKVFCQMVARLDMNIGRVVREADSGERQTVVVFLSDNGGSLPNGGTNVPLRGGKSSAYEGGLRVPFVIRYPGVQGRYSGPVISLDLRPTFAAIAGVAAPGDLDGVNLLPFLRGGDGLPHRRLFWHKGSAEVALDTRENLKMVVPDGGGGSGVYDLDVDIGERRRLPMLQYLVNDWNDWAGRNAPPRW